MIFEQLNWPCTESLSLYQFGPFQSTLADLTSASDAFKQFTMEILCLDWWIKIDIDYPNVCPTRPQSYFQWAPVGKFAAAAFDTDSRRLQSATWNARTKKCAKTSWGSSAYRFCWKILSKPDVADFHSTLFRVETMNLICKKRKYRSPGRKLSF